MFKPGDKVRLNLNESQLRCLCEIAPNKRIDYINNHLKKGTVFTIKDIKYNTDNLKYYDDEHEMISFVDDTEDHGRTIPSMYEFSSMFELVK